MKIKAIRNVPNLQERTKYAHKWDAGIDLVSCERGTIANGAWKQFPTGIAVELPAACFGLILPRSSYAKYYGLGILGGVIDQDYRGEIIVNLSNYGNNGMFSVNVGDRIAQLVIIPYFKASLEWVQDLDSSERGENGHGSTGS